MSINQVFARCIYTSVAILLSMLPMAIWGGSAVENFAIPMVFGIVIATTLVDLHRGSDPAPARRLVAGSESGRQRRHQGNPGQGLTLRAGPSMGRRGRFRCPAFAALPFRSAEFEQALTENHMLNLGTLMTF